MVQGALVIHNGQVRPLGDPSALAAIGHEFKLLANEHRRPGGELNKLFTP